jgi:hypothetical protein
MKIKISFILLFLLCAINHAIVISSFTSPLSISYGGTAATTSAGVRTSIGLGNVNNTSDANKPISTLQQTALNLKQNIASMNDYATTANINLIYDDLRDIVSAIRDKQNIASMNAYSLLSNTVTKNYYSSVTFNAQTNLVSTVNMFGTIFSKYGARNGINAVLPADDSFSVVATGNSSSVTMRAGFDDGISSLISFLEMQPNSFTLYSNNLEMLGGSSLRLGATETVVTSEGRDIALLSNNTGFTLNVPATFYESVTFNQQVSANTATITTLNATNLTANLLKIGATGGTFTNMGTTVNVSTTFNALAGIQSKNLRLYGSGTTSSGARINFGNATNGTSFIEEDASIAKTLHIQTASKLLIDNLSTASSPEIKIHARSGSAALKLYSGSNVDIQATTNILITSGGNSTFKTGQTSVSVLELASSGNVQLKWGSTTRGVKLILPQLSSAVTRATSVFKLFDKNSVQVATVNYGQLTDLSTIVTTNSTASTLNISNSLTAKSVSSNAHVGGSFSITNTVSSLPTNGGVGRLSNGFTYFIGKSDGQGSVLSNGDGSSAIKMYSPGGSNGYIEFEVGSGTPAFGFETDGRTYAKNIHNNGTITGTSKQYFASGTYTPTLTSVANVTATTAYVCQYTRIGNVVSVSGKLDLDPTLAATSTQVGISLPIASNLASNQQSSGTAFASGVAGQGAAILGDATNDRAQLQYISSDVTNQSMYFTFMYLIN